MPYQKLYGLIANDKALVAKKLFMDIIQKEFLWKNTGIQCSTDQKKNIQDLAFILFWGKIKNKKIQDNNSLAGVIVNTLREAYREYEKEETPDYFKRLQNEYEGYIEDISLFQDPLYFLLKEETLQIVDGCLLSMNNNCKTLIQYKYMDELSHQQIILKETSIPSIEASRAKLSQCMEHLRKCVFKKFRK